VCSSDLECGGLPYFGSFNGKYKVAKYKKGILKMTRYEQGNLKDGSAFLRLEMTKQ
jgi:hypothetical protein